MPDRSYDLLDEKLIPLRDVTRRVPGRYGQPVALSTVWRWAGDGCRGVVLETVRVGETRLTSVEALRRFAAACSRRLQAQS